MAQFWGQSEPLTSFLMIPVGLAGRPRPCFLGSAGPRLRVESVCPKPYRNPSLLSSGFTAGQISFQDFPSSVPGLLIYPCKSEGRRA